MQHINNIILKLAMHGRGYKNHGFIESGEDIFLKILGQHNPKICIDIGANKGLYTKKLLELTNSSVISFEPLPKAFLDLIGLQKIYPNRLTCINKGVGDRNSELEIFFGEEDSEHASFSKEINEIDSIRDKNTNTLKVMITTLDTFIQESYPKLSGVDLIKIDTEGFEYEVLTGAKETIRRLEPKFVQIEYNWHQLFKFQSLYKLGLELPGYTAYQILPYGKGLAPIDIKSPESNIYEYSNFIFVRSDVVI
jgi:FkbM family methyltransferase